MRLTRAHSRKEPRGKHDAPRTHHSLDTVQQCSMPINHSFYSHHRELHTCRRCHTFDMVFFPEADRNSQRACDVIDGKSNVLSIALRRISAKHHQPWNFRVAYLVLGEIRGSDQAETAPKSSGA